MFRTSFPLKVMHLKETGMFTLCNYSSLGMNMFTDVEKSTFLIVQGKYSFWLRFSDGQLKFYKNELKIKLTNVVKEITLNCY